MNRRKVFGTILTLIFAVVIVGSSCSQPILESEGCVAARDSVKRLYSIHLDQGPNPSAQQLESLRDFLSGDLLKKLSVRNPKEKDYLTQHDDFPKAFRVGVCHETSAGTEFEVLLFWRRNDKNREEKIRVDMKKEDRWVANTVSLKSK